ncbi:substrate-binding domain-containing protein [Rugosimonospora africana]|uniref:Sugar ABC transporter substrate-binding protein n=1 Tax=Rugosimonospora africana TaxID=556532 RepID=A0A8J3VSM5_9ACTN|nr:substrate-binding domain-containing protein [Rugosimonospora africana]GIH16766.1 sugar ABC transporter substrate-binding protein [Rugosimonospora africana]
MKSRRWRLALTAAMLAPLAAAATACASTAPTSGATGAASKSQFVIGYSQSNNAEPYRAQLNIQLQYFVKKYPNLKLLPITDAQQSSAKQVSQVQNFIAQHVDVLIISPNEPAPLAAAVQQACNAKIPVIILDRSVNNDCYTSFIGGDNVAAGKQAGDLAVKLLPNGGNVVELQGILSDQPQIDRDKGFREGIAANPNIHIVAQREAKWLKESATPIMQQWLAQYPKIDLVYSENDPMALGAYLAAAGAKRAGQIKFIGTDGLAIPDGGIRAVQQGQMAGTFIYPTCAEQAAQTAEAIVSGKPVQKTQTLQVTPVTPDNAASLYAQYDDSKFQS